MYTRTYKCIYEYAYVNKYVCRIVCEQRARARRYSLNHGRFDINKRC